MTTMHTPGPWHIGGRTILRPTFTIFHKPFGLDDVAEVYEEANACLIAAAPDLLEALKRSRAQWIHSVNAEQCLAAIAKAEGQQ